MQLLTEENHNCKTLKHRIVTSVGTYFGIIYKCWMGKAKLKPSFMMDRKEEKRWKWLLKRLLNVSLRATPSAHLNAAKILVFQNNPKCLGFNALIQCLQ